MDRAEEQLLDYEEDDINTVPVVNKAAIEKKGHVGVHGTTFRDFLLKGELTRAIADCGFEHPSEGILIGICSNVI